MTGNGYIVMLYHVSRWELGIRVEPYLNDIHQYYELLNIDTFDIIQSCVYTPYFSREDGLLIVCDDEGLLKDSYPTLPTFQQLPDGKLGEVVGMIVGDVAYVHRHEYDHSEIRGLTIDEAADLINSMMSWLMAVTKFVIKEVILPDNEFQFPDEPPFRTS